MAKNFYSDLEARAFWKSGVMNTNPVSQPDIYRRKWPIKKKWQIGTAGSCFAQHIARNLHMNGYNVLDVEPSPAGLPEADRPNFGYSLYSGRYGNIYTVRQLRQLIEEVFADTRPNPLIWERSGRFYDALRPNIEPNGFESKKEVVEARNYHLDRLKILFQNTDLFVFTMGLTEAWVHRKTGRVVPLAPGVIAGDDVIAEYGFQNADFNDVVSDFRNVMRVLNLRRTKRIRYLLTVSPVPLTATASGNHVLAATTYSKSVLRAAAGHLADNFPKVDYFPSYEIVTNPASGGSFFAPNLRSVTNQGVETVMKAFFAQHPPQKVKKKGSTTPQQDIEDLQCEEALLEAFG